MPKYKNINILYVDDEINNLISFKASLRKHYTIHTANNGSEALEIMRNNDVSVILCDQRMPEVTGVELLEKTAHDFPETIRMILTAYTDVNSIIDAINKGKIYRFISKPWNQDELKMIIDHAIEAFLLKDENKRLLEEKIQLQVLFERQQKENIISQFETLKNKVNPHFLFNCLNTLSALVHEDTAAAEKFILKLTSVYRYVLDQKDNLLVQLEDELQFMRSFFFLQKIRFGDNLILNEENFNISTFEYSIPPLAIQLLIENAIKHNIVSRNQPLVIDIYIENNFLVIKNNFQKKEHLPSSTEIGLTNLKERYSFITPLEPEFGIVGNYFIAKIPLIKNATTA